MLARLERALQGVHAAPWQQERPALASVRPAERLEELASLCAVRERADRRGLGADFELFLQNVSTRNNLDLETYAELAAGKVTRLVRRLGALVRATQNGAVERHLRAVLLRRERGHEVVLHMDAPAYRLATIICPGLTVCIAELDCPSQLVGLAALAAVLGVPLPADFVVRHGNIDADQRRIGDDLEAPDGMCLEELLGLLWLVHVQPEDDQEGHLHGLHKRFAKVAHRLSHLLAGRRVLQSALGALGIPGRRLVDRAVVRAPLALPQALECCPRVVVVALVFADEAVSCAGAAWL